MISWKKKTKILFYFLKIIYYFVESILGNGPRGHTILGLRKFPSEKCGERGNMRGVSSLLDNFGATSKGRM